MNLTPVLRHRYFDANGRPLAGGKLYTYAAGTSTPQVTYTDNTGATPNANPVILDGRGEANVWIDPELSYKFILTDANDVQQWSIDNVIGLLTADSVSTASLQGGSVTSPKLADGAVTVSKLASDASLDINRPVTTNAIRDGAVTAAKIPDGAITTPKIPDGAITQAKRVALGQQISVSSGNYSAGTSFADVTNLSVTITTTGRPVLLTLIVDGSTSPGVFPGIRAGSGTTLALRFLRGSTVISEHAYGSNTSVVYFGGGPTVFDAPDAGTYTYKVQASRLNGGDQSGPSWMRLLAFEL